MLAAVREIKAEIKHGDCVNVLADSRHGVSAKELQRQLGVTYKTAWRMGHQIRNHMAQVDDEMPLYGQVEVDETYVGGRTTGTRGRGAPASCTLKLNGSSGNLDASVAPVAGASIYNWRLMAAATPATVLQSAQTTAASHTFTGVTPGTTYIAEANVVGTAGPSAWTQSGSQMAV